MLGLVVELVDGSVFAIVDNHIGQGNEKCQNGKDEHCNFGGIYISH